MKSNSLTFVDPSLFEPYSFLGINNSGQSRATLTTTLDLTKLKESLIKDPTLSPVYKLLLNQHKLALLVQESEANLK